MPTERSGVVALIGVGLVAAGVAWENFVGPSLVGWVGIVGGHLTLLATTKRSSWRTPLDWPLLLLILTSGVSLWATTSVEITSVQVTRLVSGIAGYYGLVQWSYGSRRLVQSSMALTGAGVLLAISAPFVVDWNEAKGIPIPPSVYAAFPSLAADVVHPNVMATLMVLLFPLSFALVFMPRSGNRRQNLRWKFSGALACGLMGLVLILTKSRGGYIAGAIGLLVVLGFYRRRVLFIAATSAMIGLALWLLTTSGAQQLAGAGGVTDAATWEFRKEVWRIAVWMIGDFPFTGVGMGTFNDVASRLYPLPPVSNPGAHNLFLQIGLDLSLFGMVAFVSIALLTLWLGYRSVIEATADEHHVVRALAIGAFAGFVSFLTRGLVDIAAWGSRGSFMPWLVIGLIYALHVHVHAAKDLSQMS